MLHREYDILWFQVSINNTASVQVVQRLQRFCSVERHVILHLFIHLFNLAQERASFDVLELEVEVLLILEGAEDLDGEGAKCVAMRLPAAAHVQVLLDGLLLVLRLIVLAQREESQYFTFVDEVINLFHRSDAVFFDDFESAYLIRLVVQSLHNLAKIAEADLVLDGEVANLWLRSKQVIIMLRIFVSWMLCLATIFHLPLLGIGDVVGVDEEAVGVGAGNLVEVCAT